MTSSWLLVGQVSNLPVAETVLSRIVELAATYLVQSTLFLGGGWALLPVLFLLGRRRKTKPDGQECPSCGVSPAIAERLWKLAAVLALVTAPLSVFTGWSRPAWEWSLREPPSPRGTVVSLAATRPEPTVVTEPLAPAVIASRPALPEELAALNNDSAADRLIADEPTAEVFPLDSATSSPDHALDQRVDTVPVVIEPAVSRPPLVEAFADSHGARRDSHSASASRPTAEVEPLHASIQWLGILLVVWVALSALRLVMKGVALRRRLVGCVPIDGVLRHELNRLAPRGHSIRLLRSGPLSPGSVGERVRVRGPNDEEAVKVAHDLALTSLDKQTHESARKAEEPLTLTLSPPRRGARGQDTITELISPPRRGARGQDTITEVFSPPRRGARGREPITEPFACGLIRWTIVLPAGIEQQLSPIELQALLAHEVAHLVRRDPWWLWLGEVLCTCLAFQPLNFLARRRWQQAAEMLCDDWAVERQVSATALASCLTRIAEGRLDRRAAVMGLTAVGPAGSLTQRIEWLLRTGRATEPKRPRGRTLATLLTFAAGLFVGTYGPRLSFVLPAEAGDDLEAIVAPNESKLWNDIDRDLAETLSELARLDLQLSNDPDPEVAALASRLRTRANSLSEQLAQSVRTSSHAERGNE